LNALQQIPPIFGIEIETTFQKQSQIIINFIRGNHRSIFDTLNQLPFVAGFAKRVAPEVQLINNHPDREYVNLVRRVGLFIVAQHFRR